MALTSESEFHPHTGHEEAIELILESVGEVAVLPQVVFKIVESTANPDSTAEEIERTIMVDPGFSAKILALANSAMFALPRRVTSIKDAVMLLGFKQVRQLAMAAGVFDLFAGKTDKESLRRRMWWRHSLDTAICANWLGSRMKNVNADEAYTCGLLHFIGKTVMCRYDSSKYDIVMAMVGDGLDDFESEVEVFGCDHVDVTLTVAQRWQFPEKLLFGLDYMDDQIDEGLGTKLRATVSISHHIAEIYMNKRVEEAKSKVLLPGWAMKVLGYGPFEQMPLIEGGIKAIEAARAA